MYNFDEEFDHGTNHGFNEIIFETNNDLSNETHIVEQKYELEIRVEMSTPIRNLIKNHPPK